MAWVIQGLLFVHLLAFMLLGSGIVLNSLSGAVGRRTTKVSDHLILGKFMQRGGALAGMGGFTLVVTGTLLIAITAGGAGFLRPWVIVAYLCWAISLISGAGVVAPRAAALGAEVEKLAAAGTTEAPEVAAQFGKGPLFVAARVNETIFLVALLMMVFKPGA